MLFMSADYIKMYSGLFYDGSKHNERMSRTKNSVQGSILWNQGHIVALQ